MQKPIQNNSSLFSRIWFLALLVGLQGIACRLPYQLIHPYIADVSSPTPSSTPKPASSPTRSPPSLPTWTPSSSPTPSATPTAEPTDILKATRFSTGTILTPLPNQLVIDQQIWQLVSADTPSYISALGRLYSPPKRNDPSPAYVFLRMNFECRTGQSLIQAFAGSDMGLTFVHKQSGYSDISIQDMQGHKYLVTLLGACWLAAPIPKTQAQDVFFVLNFKDLPPFQFKLQPAAAVQAQKICFVSDRDGSQELFIADPDGSSTSRLTTDFSRASEPAWSPDHFKVAYVTDRGSNPDIKIIDSQGVKISTLAESPFAEGAPTWTPDGRMLLFHTQRDGNWEIYVTSFMLDQPKNITLDSSNDMYPSVSPNGEKIAFQSDRDGEWQIYMMHFDGTGLEKISRSSSEAILPSWSPNQQEILYWSMHSGSWRLYLDMLNGQDPIALTTYENPGLPISKAAWSPDGDSIIVSLLKERFLQLYRLDLDSMELIRLFDYPANFSMPAW